MAGTSSGKSPDGRTPPYKVTFLVTHSAPGGVQEIWADLAEGFRERGYKADLVAMYPGDRSGREAITEIPWRYLVPERPAGITGGLRLLWALATYFRREQTALAVTAMPVANVLAPLASLLGGHGTRIIISHHQPISTYGRFPRMLDAWTGSLRTVADVVSVSRTVDASLEGRPAGYRAKRRVIYNALPPKVERVLAELAERTAKGAKGRRVVAIGRLAPEKNLPVLIRAAAYMLDVDVELVGAGPDEALLKELGHKLGVEHRVRFLGQLRREEALIKLAAGAVFVQPSIFEGHSLALIEAAKLGIPLIVSDTQSQVEGVTASDGIRCG